MGTLCIQDPLRAPPVRASQIPQPMWKGMKSCGGGNCYCFQPHTPRKSIRCHHKLNPLQNVKFLFLFTSHGEKIKTENTFCPTPGQVLPGGEKWGSQIWNTGSQLHQTTAALHPEFPWKHMPTFISILKQLSFHLSVALYKQVKLSSASHREAGPLELGTHTLYLVLKLRPHQDALMLRELPPNEKIYMFFHSS